MKIAICGSMAFVDNMLDLKQRLEQLGHSVLVTDFAAAYAGKSPEEIQTLTIRDKNEKDAIREFWPKIRACDAILVLNYDRKGIAGYIGGNTLMEIGFAHVLNKRIFFINPVPDIPYYRSELEAVYPEIIGNDWSRLKS